MKVILCALASALFLTPIAFAAEQKPLSSVARAVPNLVSSIGQPLRYRPDGADFVIENGGEFFNRPLYGGNSAFRVDAGDQPEFSLYLPGHAGNLRLGLRTAAGTKWLHECSGVLARYRPGSMLYEIRDPLLGSGVVLRLQALALYQTEGLIVRLEAEGLRECVEVVAAYGGFDGKRGKRDGDIGTEAVPISQYFQLKPANCEGNRFEFGSTPGSAFQLKAKLATIAGLLPAGAELALADAGQWGTLKGLLASAQGIGEQGGASSQAPLAVPRFPVLTARFTVVPATQATPLYLCLQRLPVAGLAAAEPAAELADYRKVTTLRAGKESKVPGPVLAAPYVQEELPRLFAETTEHFRALRAQIEVQTPDPYLNAAVGALNVGVDAVWDEAQGAVMHGAIAWRSKLLGWRGPYAPDVLGWHERARRHLSYWATRQNTDPIPERLPPADEKSNLARNEAGLHSNGDMSNSHYDMNAVYIDALFRHLLWTGDLAMARELWPVIERHLAWERRLFRREFGPEKLPLYEAYAMIWASDDLQYNGGGAAHASAYNYYHNVQAARLARLLGKDAAPYETEAGLIARGMRELLWMPERGMFGEYKDLLGLQRVHPSAALWTFYHMMDAGFVSPAEAYQMSGYILSALPSLPVRGPGVPEDARYHMLSSSDWMPYTWSINNVVMGENIHTALGLWQAGRPEEAFLLTKSSLLASMFMGICPGNVGTLNYLDVYRREAQRDFADGGGVTARVIVEGLFGVRPDALAGELFLQPGLPSAWGAASLRHPELSVAYQRREREGDELWTLEQRFKKPLSLRMRIPGGGGSPVVTVNGVVAALVPVPGTGNRECFELRAAAAPTHRVVVQWIPVAGGEVRLRDSGWPENAGQGPGCGSEAAGQGSIQATGAQNVDWSLKLSSATECVDLGPVFNAQVTQIFSNEYRSPRSPYVSLAIPKQGVGAWAGHVNATAEIDDTGLRALSKRNQGRLLLPNGVPVATPAGPGEKNVVFTSLWDNYPQSVELPLKGSATQLYLLLAGSTNWMQSRIDNAEIVVSYEDGSTARLALRNPETWWPIEQDYLVDDYQFRVNGSLPLRVDLKTGRMRDLKQAGQGARGETISGGAATVLVLRLDPKKELRTLTLRTLSNEVVVGLLGASLVR